MSENWDSQYAQVARLQHAELERLHAELDQLRTENQRLIAWIMGDGPDALTELQRVYSDPRTNENNKLKAAGLALPFERAKPVSTSVVVDWAEYTRSIRLKALEKDKARWALEGTKVLDATPVGPRKPLDLDAPTPPTILGEGPEPAA
jgi:hypothetical protein